MQIDPPPNTLVLEDFDETFSLTQGDRESFEQASTHLYFAAHDDPREATLEVVSVGPGSLTIVGRSAPSPIAPNAQPLLTG